MLLWLWFSRLSSRTHKQLRALRFGPSTSQGRACVVGCVCAPERDRERGCAFWVPAVCPCWGAWACLFLVLCTKRGVCVPREWWPPGGCASALLPCLPADPSPSLCASHPAAPVTMVWRLSVLLWAVLAAEASSSSSSGLVVRCQPCEPGALAQCKPLAPECPEAVREPGCGCCLTCALQEGRPCGVYTERCGSGLSCRPPSDERKPLQALLDGKGLCANVSADAAAEEEGGGRGGGGSGSSGGSKLHDLLLRGAHRPGNSSDSDEDQNISNRENQPVPNTHRLLDSKSHAHHTKIDTIRKEHAKNTQRYKYDSQSTDTLNFSSESKQDAEYGPCRIEMEDTLNNLKILNVLSPGGLHIPNCDKKGFYKKKQCRPSRGRKRGYCWCVDKYGQPLPGYDGKGKGDVHCLNLESK